MEGYLNAAQFVERLKGAKKTASGWQAKCPAHEDGRASLSIADGAKGIILHCHAGCQLNDICRAVGIKPTDLFHQSNGHKLKPEIVATYDYVDEHSRPLFQVCRFYPKDFRQRQPDGTWSIKGVRRVPFRLPQLTEASLEGRPIYIVEGEKDVLALEKAGFVATCNCGGAGKWLQEYNQHFKGAQVVIVADKDKAGREHAGDIEAHLHGIAISVKVIEVPDVNGKPCKDVADFFAAGGLASELDEIANQPETKPKTLLDRINERIFDPGRRPPQPVPRYHVNDIPICTPGNISCITAGVKSGKSAVVGAMIASTIAGFGCDCLGFTSENPNGWAVLHIDTEQSLFDHWALLDRAMKRAETTVRPDWLLSYCLTGFNIPDLRASLPLLMKEAHRRFLGIHSVIIDGGADMVSDVNDTSESGLFVAELQSRAIEHDTTVTCVIHFNPNSDKVRGHLGSQLERKAETNLRLDKDGDLISLWSDKNRRAPIPRERGPMFIWDNDVGMHVTTERRIVVSAPKTKGDLMAHIPTEGRISFYELEERAKNAGIANRVVRPLLNELLTDGSVHIWEVKRKGTRPAKHYSRHPQPEEKEPELCAK